MSEITVQIFESIGPGGAVGKTSRSTGDLAGDDFDDLIFDKALSLDAPADTESPLSEAVPLFIVWHYPDDVTADSTVLVGSTSSMPGFWLQLDLFGDQLEIAGDPVSDVAALAEPGTTSGAILALTPVRENVEDAATAIEHLIPVNGDAAVPGYADAAIGFSHKSGVLGQGDGLLNAVLTYEGHTSVNANIFGDSFEENDGDAIAGDLSTFLVFIPGHAHSLGTENLEATGGGTPDVIDVLGIG